MNNEIAQFGALNLFIYSFFLLSFSELIVNCVIGFDRFVRNLEDQWKW